MSQETKKPQEEEREEDKKESKDLKERAIDIKGKKYVLVADRVTYFNREYENGAIQTELLTDPKDPISVYKAIVIPDLKNPERKYTAYAREVKGQGRVNKTSALENAETSAVGRALAFMGIGVIDSVASFDEVKNAKDQQKEIKKKQSTKKIIEQKINSAEDEETLNKIEKWIESKDLKNKQEYLDMVIAKRGELNPDEDIPVIEED